MPREYVEQRGDGLYVVGTRVSLDSVVCAFLEGQSPETIAEGFDSLTLETVYGAIAYYLANQSEVDAYLRRQRRQFETKRRQAEPLPVDLQSRLNAARRQLRVGKAE